MTTPPLVESPVASLASRRPHSGGPLSTERHDAKDHTRERFVSRPHSPSADGGGLLL